MLLLLAPALLSVLLQVNVKYDVQYYYVLVYISLPLIGK